MLSQELLVMFIHELVFYMVSFKFYQIPHVGFVCHLNIFLRGVFNLFSLKSHFYLLNPLANLVYIILVKYWCFLAWSIV